MPRGLRNLVSQYKLAVGPIWFRFPRLRPQFRRSVGPGNHHCRFARNRGRAGAAGGRRDRHQLLLLHFFLGRPEPPASDGVHGAIRAGSHAPRHLSPRLIPARTPVGPLSPETEHVRQSGVLLPLIGSTVATKRASRRNRDAPISVPNPLAEQAVTQPSPRELRR